MAEPGPRPLLTPGRVRELLAAHDLRPRKALGQHYLADPNTARKVARLGGAGPGETVDAGVRVARADLAGRALGEHVEAAAAAREVIAHRHPIRRAVAQRHAADAQRRDTPAHGQPRVPLVVDARDLQEVRRRERPLAHAITC